MSTRLLWLAIVLALASIVFQSVTWAAGCDLDTARVFHSQAQATPDPSEHRRLLELAWQACPNAKVGYDLAMIRLDAGDLDGALARLVAARDVVPAIGIQSERLRPAIQARIAEVYLARGEIGRAEAEIGFAASLPGGGAHPVVMAVRRAIDTTPARQLMDAEQIRIALGAQRAVGVSERIALFILFDYDQDRPNAEGEQQVSELAKALAPLASESRRILLVGHTDPRGDAAYNRDLSQRRAEAVKAMLAVREPALTDKLEARGRGEEQPRYAGNREADHRLNRRVEVVVLPGDG